MAKRSRAKSRSNASSLSSPAASSSSLFKAIGARDEKSVRKLLKTGGVDLSSKDDKGRTPLQAARYYRSTEIEVMLLDAGAEPDKDDLNLYWAVGTKRADIVKKFIELGADVEMEAIGGTPLDSAASWNMAEIVQVLIDAGADINAVSEFNGTPLAQAVDKNSTEAALVLIRAGATLDAPENSDGTLLTTAIGAGNRDIALALIEAGADVNARGKIRRLGKNIDYGKDMGANATPLILATRVGDQEIVDALLARGADVHARDEDGKTALDWAKADKHAAIAKRLGAAAKANPAKENLNEDLLIAAGNGDVASASNLLSRGAKVDARDTRSNRLGFTPLMLAAQRGDVKLATLLLDAGAAVNAHDNDGEPPDPNVLKNIKFLIANGADEYISSMGMKLGWTPLHLAVEANKPAMVQLLLARGAGANAVDLANRTPAKLAKEAENSKILDLLKRAGGSERAPRQAAEAKPHLKARKKATAKAKPKPKKKQSKAPPLPQVDFAAAAKSPAYETALAAMEKITGSKRQPMRDRAGLFTFHVHSSKAKGLDLRAIHENFLARGFYAFSTDATSDNQLALAPTTDKYALIAEFQTNGANYDLGPEEIAQWLRELEEEVPFRLTGIGWDFLKGYFVAERADPRDLAERMYEFCPDIVDQGVGDVDALAESLAESDHLFFWWD